MVSSSYPSFGFEPTEVLALAKCTVNLPPVYGAAFAVGVGLGFVKPREVQNELLPSHPGGKSGGED